MIKTSVVFGTRPEAIKLAPVVLRLRDDPRFACQVCVTAQHRQMLDQVTGVFGIVPDTDLDLMRPNQTLGSLTSRAIEALDQYFSREKPDLVLVQGDTTTVFCAALTAFYHRIPVGHVEAGLRTGNLRSPWPEEANRVLSSRLADLHFAPTCQAQENLLREGIPQGRIFVTGNTVIDALLIAQQNVAQSRLRIDSLPDFLQPGRDASDPRMVLITGHRRENFGEGFENICRAIAELARRFPSAHFVYPVHLNPNVRDPVSRILGNGVARGEGDLLRNVHLIDPLPYLDFVGLMSRSHLILTDSGGIQEEAPSLGKPVLVMRDTTERPEAVERGAVKLVGTDAAAIVDGVSLLLGNEEAYRAMSTAGNPFGDGHAATRIVDLCAIALKS